MNEGEEFNSGLPASWGEQSTARSSEKVPKKVFIWIGVGLALALGGTIAFAGITGQNEAAEIVWVLVCVILGACAYFLPTIIADQRDHRNQTGIVVLNLFLGWTVIGWVGALIWAVYEEKR